jgi:hypothetical protein
MPPKKKRVLTSDQRKALKDAEASIARAYAEARRSLLDIGFEPNDGSFRCLASPLGHCRAFQRDKRPGRGLLCARAGCRHSFLSHDVR